MEQQLQELIGIANREGLYDAADWLKTALHQPSRVFDDSDWNAFNDVFFDLGSDSKLDRKTLQQAYDSLPNHIKSIAIQWGMGDTVFRDEACKFLKKIKNT